MPAGRPNVGKSSLANRLVGDDRQLVSEIPGTTRDAVDIRMQFGQDSYLLVDTPGMRRKRSIGERVERYSVVAALRSLERSDVAIVVLDCSLSFSHQDARLLNLAHEKGRGLLVVVNKTDLLDPGALREYLDELKHGMRFVEYAPVLSVSALTGKAARKILPQVKAIYQHASSRFTTGDLNRFVAEVTARQLPPVIKGRRAKIFYIAQTDVNPPTFVAWVNDPNRLPESYRRYLDRQLVHATNWRFAAALVFSGAQRREQKARAPVRPKRKKH